MGFAGCKRKIEDAKGATDKGKPKVVAGGDTNATTAKAGAAAPPSPAAAATSGGGGPDLKAPPADKGQPATTAPIDEITFVRQVVPGNAPGFPNHLYVLSPPIKPGTVVPDLSPIQKGIDDLTQAVKESRTGIPQELTTHSTYTGNTGFGNNTVEAITYEQVAADGNEFYQHFVDSFRHNKGPTYLHGSYSELLCSAPVKLDKDLSLCQNQRHFKFYDGIEDDDRLSLDYEYEPFYAPIGINFRTQQTNLESSICEDITIDAEGLSVRNSVASSPIEALVIWDDWDQKLSLKDAQNTKSAPYMYITRGVFSKSNDSRHGEDFNAVDTPTYLAADSSANPPRPFVYKNRVKKHAYEVSHAILNHLFDSIEEASGKVDIQSVHNVCYSKGPIRAEEGVAEGMYLLKECDGEKTMVWDAKAQGLVLYQGWSEEEYMNQLFFSELGTWTTTDTAGGNHSGFAVASVGQERKNGILYRFKTDVSCDCAFILESRVAQDSQSTSAGSDDDDDDGAAVALAAYREAITALTTETNRVNAETHVQTLQTNYSQLSDGIKSSISTPHDWIVNADNTFGSSEKAIARRAKASEIQDLL
jgi:hypothetical protein